MRLWKLWTGRPSLVGTLPRELGEFGGFAGI
jgi:hypothetical protein